MYRSLKYNSKERWLSYWHQINESLSGNPESLLIVGKGSGIVENAISTIAPRVKITTLDIAPGLFPDVIADIRNQPFRDLYFDCILCCQVLEHIPFAEVNEVLREFHRISRDSVVISVPHIRKHLKMEIDAPLIGRSMFILKYPFTKKNKEEVTDNSRHFWEINRGVSYRLFRRTLRKFFIIKKTFLNEMNCTHRFFLLRKIV
jgi:ubiquinone/menaquinone biosynthesis C-methylase UbiE